MSSWRQQAVDLLFVATEAIAWYIMLHVAATAMEQGFLTDLADRIDAAVRASQVADPGRGAQALAIVRSAAGIDHGPSLIITLLTGLGGFWLMRMLVRYHFEGALGAIVLLTGSVIGLNVLLHVALLGDLRVWDSTGLARFMTDPTDYSAAGLDLEAFIAHPDVGSPHGAALGMVFAGLIAMWLRFAIAARATVSFERVLRSFTIGFACVLAGVVFARLEGLRGLTIFAVPHFVLGVLALAVANHARAVIPIEGEGRTGPWMAAVGGTVAVLVGVAMLLGLLAFLHVGAVLDVVGTAAARLVAFLLVIVVTPIFWVVGGLLRLLLGDRLKGVLENLQLLQPDLPQQDPASRASGPVIPGFVQNGLKFLAVLAIAWVVYRVALLIVRRRREAVAAVDEVRSRTTGGIGFGGLLRGLLPRGSVRAAALDWMRRQPIYRLYGRAVYDADARGFRYMPGETPIEFSTRASRMMAAPYAPIGEAFDRARYGRHYPSPAEVRALESDLAAWEAAMPPTEELRQRLAGAAPLSEADEFQLAVMQRRRERLRAHEATQRVDF